ncbi:MAG: S8/S53 family peptidase [Muribaculaceae bacterium]
MKNENLFKIFLVIVMGILSENAFALNLKNYTKTPNRYYVKTISQDPCPIKKYTFEIVDSVGLKIKSQEIGHLYSPIYIVDGIEYAQNNELILSDVSVGIHVLINRLNLNSLIFGVDSIPLPNKIYRLKFKTMDVYPILSKIKASGLCKFVDTNDVFFKTMDGAGDNNPYISAQWYIKNHTFPNIDINATNAWSYSTGGVAKVAILDGGIYMNHEDLHTNIKGGKDVSADGTGGASQEFDTVDHGTQVAGVLSAKNNKVGIVGVANSARIYSIKFYAVSRIGDNIYYSANQYDVANAFYSAVNDFDVDVINFSHHLNYSDVVTNVINDITVNGRNGKGCIVVASSGNLDSGTVQFPASMPNVLSVGGITKNGIRWTGNGIGSCYGENLDVVAGGADIFTTAAPVTGSGGYLSVLGTSFATPQVAGLAALLVGRFPNLTRQEVMDIIKSTCRKLSGYNFNTYKSIGTWNNQVGYGLIDAHKAMKSTTIKNMEIVGSSIICDSAFYYINNSATATHSNWSFETTASEKPRMTNNNDPHGEITLVNDPVRRRKGVLSVDLLIEGESVRISKTIYSTVGESTSLFPGGYISQPSCTYHNVVYPPTQKNISGSTEYIYKGCTATIYFNQSDVYGCDISLSAGAPEYWSYNPESCILVLRLPRYAGGIPFTFNFAGNDKCISSKHINFFTWSDNTPHTLNITSIGSTLTAEILVNESSEDISAPSQENITEIEVDIANMLTGQTITKKVKGLNCDFDTSGWAKGLYIVTAKFNGKILRERTMIME